MQLNKLAYFHRALSDMTRLKIVFLLKDGERHGQALAELLQVSAPTITHHISKLREASLIESRRDKNTIYFRLVKEVYSKYVEQSIRLIERSIEEEVLEVSADKYAEKETEKDKLQKYKQAVMKAYFAADGKLKNIPAKYKKKLIVLEQIIAGFELGKVYSEQEVNEKIRIYHDDVATLRREFIMQFFMSRENNAYELNPNQLWVKWENLT